MATPTSQNEVMFAISIAGENLKCISAVLHFMMKIGKELIIELDGDKVAFKALNDGKSAFVGIEFQESYFIDIQRSVDTFSCKLNVKPVCAILKNIKNINGMSIRSVVTGSEHELIFEVRVTNGMIRTHKFSYQDSDMINALFDEDSASFLQSEPKVFIQLFEHMYQSPEVIIGASEHNFTVRSFHSDKNSDTKRHLTTGLSVDVHEFDRYDFKSEIDITEEIVFCSKEIRAILGLCEATDIPIFTFLFTNGSRPIKLKCKHRHYSASLIIATMESSQQQQHQELPPRLAAQSSRMSRDYDQTSPARHRHRHGEAPDGEVHGSDLGTMRSHDRVVPKGRPSDMYDQQQIGNRPLSHSDFRDDSSNYDSGRSGLTREPFERQEAPTSRRNYVEEREAERLSQAPNQSGAVKKRNFDAAEDDPPIDMKGKTGRTPRQIHNEDEGDDRNDRDEHVRLTKLVLVHDSSLPSSGSQPKPPGRKPQSAAASGKVSRLKRMLLELSDDDDD